VSHARDVARDTVNAITRKRTHVEQRLAGALEDALVKIAELEHVANGLLYRARTGWSLPDCKEALERAAANRTTGIK
jgi:hypothetical protein